MKISEILERLDDVRQNIKTASEALENGTDVIKKGLELNEFQVYYEKYWSVIERGYYDGGYYTANKKSEGSIKSFFNLVQGADISRRELRERLEPLIKAVEIYIDKQRAEEERLKGYIRSCYDKFFRDHFKEYEFIFGSDKIREGFVEFLISGYEGWRISRLILK